MQIAALDREYTYEDIFRTALRLTKTFSPFLTMVSLGKSLDNREIFAIRAGKGEQHIICCAGIHGRESINPIVLLRMAETYGRKYDTGKSFEGMSYKELFSKYSIYLIPLVNPDGYMIARFGFHTIRNQQLKKKCMDFQIPYEEWKGNARGVDINRNFMSRTFVPKNRKGAASEPETKTLIHVFENLPSGAFLDFHSRGESIYYYRNQMDDEYNKRQKEIATRLSTRSNYRLEEPESEILEGDSGGNSVHYYSEYIKKPALTIETVEDDAKFPFKMEYALTVYEQVCDFPLELTKFV